MNLSEQEVWMRVYCASVTGTISSGKSSSYAADSAKLSADLAVKDFAKRFPAFRFASEENKE